MKIPDIIIAIDGYSSTGKSSLAKAVAKDLGMLYLDSGALYRAVTLFAMENSLAGKSDGVSPRLEGRLDELGSLHFDDRGRTCIGERSIEKEIRSMEVSALVSSVASLPYVRKFVDGKLHEAAGRSPVVMDGRDIGTTVFPEAQIKIFMTAREGVRAKRRYDELVSKGERPSFEEVLKNIRERDWADSHREVSPLRRAADSFELDNSDMTPGEELAWVRGLIRGKFNLL